MLFVGERRRSRRLPGAIRRERSEQIKNSTSSSQKLGVLVFELEVCDDRTRG
jgi:hypothetical protein